jgi:competence ComEA-like helix-hairpin-helix protein
VKKIQQQIRSFFGFSRAQTNGFVALLMIVSIALFSKPIYHTWVSGRSIDFSREQQTLDSLTKQWRIQQAETNHISAEDAIAVTVFEFNPNTASADDLKALGFSQRLTKGLINYRAKGGEFRIKSDVKKLYGMDSAFYKTLVPFIQLPEKIVYEKKTTPYNTERESTVFNLNEGDTTQFQGVYGIGPVLAERIVKYREGLGGFVSNEQLKEVYGLDSTAVNKLLKASFLAGDFIPRKININTADESIFSAHPYFSKKIAKTIATYRFQHGKFQSVDDLRRIETLDKKVLDRVYPYLTIE